MRALAIGLVLVYHAGVRQLPGGFVGVDVFFVISGFLITGLLIREVEATGRVSLRQFYARRAKRLLPATGLVLAVTAALTWLTTSVVQWRDFGLDIVSAALYVVNWRLADRSVDYLAEDIGPSPVQHFWSLAVEEQFYIVWPLLLVLLALLMKRRQSLRPRMVMTVGILLVLVPSFVWSVHVTATSPSTAFFVTPTRLWELGIGALVAIGATAWVSIPRFAASVLGWLGLATVLASGFLLTADVAWPGYAAMAPVLGTAALIVAGFASGNAGPAGLLSWGPAVWVGGLSYSLYLWHWPVLVAATAHWGDLGAKKGLLVVALSFIPAYLSFRYIENPFRFARPIARSNALALSIGANFTVIGVAAGLVLVLLIPSTSIGSPGGVGPSGASVLQHEQGTVDSLDQIQWFTPDPATAPEDLPAGYANKCTTVVADDAVKTCELGQADGAITIAVVGDSKMLQWESAIDSIAKSQGWRVVSFTKSACGFHTGMQSARSKPYTACAEWNQKVLPEVIDLQPDLVLTSQIANRALRDPDDPATLSHDVMVDAIAERWAELQESDIPVAVLLDNPNPGPVLSVYECVADNMKNLSACTFPRDEGIRASGAVVLQEAAARGRGVSVLDVNRFICPEEVCVPVIGNTLIYRQTSHLTDTFVRTLIPALSEQLVPVVGALR